MKHFLTGLVALAVTAIASAPASAITCPPGTHLTVVKNKSGSHMVCAQTMAQKKKAATPKPIPKHT